MLVTTHPCDFNVQAQNFTLKEVLIGSFINDLYTPVDMQAFELSDLIPIGFKAL